jgi:hypothetical protein
MKLKILILMLALAFVGGCSSYSLDQTLSNVSEPEFNGIINASIIGATCHQIECKCSTWGCAAYCMECEGVKWNKQKS